MAQLILEGTWEEVAQRAPELVGKRVKLIVMEDTLPLAERPLSEALAGLIGVIDSSDPTQQGYAATPYTDALAEKFRKQGLKIP
jgi:hypothetical protein